MLEMMVIWTRLIVGNEGSERGEILYTDIYIYVCVCVCILIYWGITQSKMLSAPILMDFYIHTSIRLCFLIRSRHRAFPVSTFLFTSRKLPLIYFEDIANGICWWVGYGVGDNREGLRMANPLAFGPSTWEMELLLTEMGKVMGGTIRSFFLEMWSWHFLLDT